MLSYVVAISENGVMGINNTLPWHIPNDLKFFKEVTLSKSKTMIMGRETFEALPKILPERHHIVITRNRNYKINSDNVTIIHNIDDLKPYIESPEEYFVIGGGQIFSLLMPYAEKMYLTIIHEEFKGDTFFPKYNKDEWRILSKEEGVVDSKNKHNHTIYILERIKSIN
ncbi:dihydrofolate reductase [Clostridium cylindrosporum]|uniref:Dihydrofolate reductase n=1 Tax=Clostridium cylindrosporum DSM 605 TaxID=1121307 RepID=A0A0J8DG59_CLOCY|nr:dihydrofolate reductase [Clostridium cylindrosporum]KMT23224.1 dihydrofolate reductase DfrA [Clostridium cylindrosporum DSM 605]